MTEINVLDKSVFNRIAAGEVVDRPCSVVKELVENSIDAGATSISVAVKGGGIKYIRVSDNGKGISKDDLKTAFLPHATSKIKCVEDLDKISTLGFRGEALPSIASVSKVTVVTRRNGDNFGTRYIVDNGNELDFGGMGAPLGTSVTVENLFERIPARKKFLSKELTEENAITNLISRFILANNKVAFKYTVNDKIVLNSLGEGVKSAIETVYGRDYLSNMIEIHSTMSDIVLQGFVNKPSFSKHSKAFQTLIVNGRYVLNDDISYTVYGCYQKYLMTRQYPTYVLYLDLPYDFVDVNVHPNKMEVKFAVPAIIKKLVSDAVKQQVIEAVSVPKEIEGVFNLTDTKNDRLNRDEHIFNSHFFKSENDISLTQKENVSAEIVNEILPEKDKNDNGIRFSEKKEFSSTQSPNRITSESLGETSSVRIISRFTERNTEKLSEPTLSDAFFTLKDKSYGEQIHFDIGENTKIAGKLFNTYIMVEQGDSLYLIDQHAAHEKLLYDRLIAQFDMGKVSVQNMLIPYSFTVSERESELLDENAEMLKKAGFEIVKDGNRINRYHLKSLPLCCSGLNAQNFISDFLKENFSDNVPLLPDVLKEKLMQSACKAATKGEDDLSEEEIKCLVKQMSNETKELFCPHGRPVMIRLTRNEIEKWFKRIV